MFRSGFCTNSTERWGCYSSDFHNHHFWRSCWWPFNHGESNERILRIALAAILKNRNGPGQPGPPCHGFWEDDFPFPQLSHCRLNLGGGHSNIFHVHRYLGTIPILTNIFQMGWNHQLGIYLSIFAWSEIARISFWVYISLVYPIGSTYGILTYICHNPPNVAKYTSPMNPMGMRYELFNAIHTPKLFIKHFRIKTRDLFAKYCSRWFYIWMNYIMTDFVLDFPDVLYFYISTLSNFAWDICLMLNLFK